jgi:hypothetical protein
MLEYLYVWWILFGIVLLLLYERGAFSSKSFVSLWTRLTHLRQNVVVQPSSPASPETSASPSEPPLGWWERRKARGEALKKAKLEKRRMMNEGALLLEVETKRRLEAIFLFFILPVACLLTLLYFAPEIAGFFRKIETTGTIGSHELPDVVVKTREWMLYTLQIPTIGLLMGIGVVVVYGLFLLSNF